MVAYRIREIALAVIVARLAASVPAFSVDYDVVYVRQPRFGDGEHTRWPEVFHPATLEPGCDLMLMHPDGLDEVALLVKGNARRRGDVSC